MHFQQNWCPHPPAAAEQLIWLHPAALVIPTPHSGHLFVFFPSFPPPRKAFISSSGGQGSPACSLFPQRPQ